MARDLRPKFKMSRKFGENLLGSPKFSKLRKYPPGQHGPNQSHKKISGYGLQLREKQKVKWLYGVLERQFARYVAAASRKTGDTSKILVSMLESRLDNVVYRAGFASTRRGARQMVAHGHIMVNNKKLDIPSYTVNVGEEISLKTKSKQGKLFEGVGEKISKLELPMWLNVDVKTLTAKMLNVPTLENPNFNAATIIEFYSR